MDSVYDITVDSPVRTIARTYARFIGKWCPTTWISNGPPESTLVYSRPPTKLPGVQLTYILPKHLHLYEPSTIPPAGNPQQRVSPPYKNAPSKEPGISPERPWAYGEDLKPIQPEPIFKAISKAISPESRTQYGIRHSIQIPKHLAYILYLHHGDPTKPLTRTLLRRSLEYHWNVHGNTTPPLSPTTMSSHRHANSQYRDRNIPGNVLSKSPTFTSIPFMHRYRKGMFRNRQATYTETIDVPATLS
jgi:hypothetical protein